MSAWTREHPRSADHPYEPLHEDHEGLRITRCKICGLATEIDSDKFEHGMPAALLSIVLDEVRRWGAAAP